MTQIERQLVEALQQALAYYAQQAAILQSLTERVNALAGQVENLQQALQRLSRN